MEFLVVTGLSGAGKSNTLHCLEDLGYYCVDNLPPALLETFYDLCEKSKDKRMKKVAMGVDSRSVSIFPDVIKVLEQVDLTSKKFKVVFLDCKEEILLNRFKETRRKHPLADHMTGGSTIDALALETELLRPVKEKADYIIDTSSMSPAQLKERIVTIFADEEDRGIHITCLSFGFKYGLPLEADLVFDVRCLPNPYYVPELKNLTGLDKEVRDYVLDSEVSTDFLNKLLQFLDFSIPQYQKEGKNELVIGVGCTGGKHRSVTIARLLNSHFIENNLSSLTQHRDIWKA